ncbi:MAG: cation:proton antiporter [Candidatus Bathyarchaeia archaeon]
MVDVSLALLISALIIVIGFLGNYFFKRTGLPDMLFLIIIGVLVGPVLKLFEPSIVMGLAPYIAALALVFILFDGGMSLNIRQVLSHSPRAVLLAVLGFIFSMFAVALFMIVLYRVPLYYGLLFGSIYGGSSSIVVVSLASKIHVSEKCSTTLILESATTDILCIVISLSLIGIIITGQANYLAVATGIITEFAVGAVFGLIIGIVWLFLLKFVSPMPFSYMLTLAIALLAYTLSENFGGSGALSSLLFGLILGNEKEIMKHLRRKETRMVAVDAGLKRFESEIAFLIRTFFFVFLGIIATISSISLLFLGIILTLLLLLVRFGAVWLTTIGSELQKERSIMTFVLTRGLAAAVLATLPIQYGLLYPDTFINLAVVIIMSTAIIATVGIAMASHLRRQHAQGAQKEQLDEKR